MKCIGYASVCGYYKKKAGMEPPNILVAENETIIKLDLNITLEK
jgi:hypothetical protein